MMAFYRTRECKGCDFIQQLLDEMVLDYKVVTVAGRGDIEGLPPGIKPPIFVYGDDVIEGSGNIIRYLDRFEKFKALWEKYQSDACYCDEDEEAEL
jgi:hypothetical protein